MIVILGSEQVSIVAPALSRMSHPCSLMNIVGRQVLPLARNFFSAALPNGIGSMNILYFYVARNDVLAASLAKR